MMIRLSLILVIGLSLPTMAHAHRMTGGTHPCFLPKTLGQKAIYHSGGNARTTAPIDTVQHQILQTPRGGDGGTPLLDPELTVKIFSVIVGLQGLVMNTGPKASNEMYGITGNDNDALAQFLGGQFGAGILSTGIFLYCLLFEKTSLVTANKALYVFWMYQAIRQWLSGTAEEVGASDAMKMTVTLFTLSLVGLMQDDYATMTIKVSSAFWALSGIQMLLAPDTAMKTWKNDIALTPVTSFLMKMFGIWLLSFGAINGSMLFWDASPVQACGYFSAIWALSHGYFLVDGTYKELNIPEGSQVVWMLVHLLIVVTTLLQSS